MGGYSLLIKIGIALAAVAAIFFGGYKAGFNSCQVDFNAAQAMWNRSGKDFEAAAREVERDMQRQAVAADATYSAKLKEIENEKNNFIDAFVVERSVLHPAADESDDFGGLPEANSTASGVDGTPAAELSGEHARFLVKFAASCAGTAAQLRAAQVILQDTS